MMRRTRSRIMRAEKFPMRTFQASFAN